MKFAKLNLEASRIQKLRKWLPNVWIHNKLQILHYDLLLMKQQTYMYYVLQTLHQIMTVSISSFGKNSCSFKIILLYII